MSLRSSLFGLRWWSLLLLGGCLLTTGESRADGLMLNGVSPRSIGRGGTNIAHWDNAGILFDNPAGAVNIRSNGLAEAGMSVMLTDFGYTDPDNPGGVHSNRACPLPEFGIIQRSDDGIWAYGLGVYVPAGFSERYLMEGPAPFDGPQTYKSFGALGKILPALACRVTDNFSVGGTLGVGICHVEMEGPYTLQSLPLAGTPTRMDMQSTGATLVWSLGAQYELTDATTLGVVYQSASPFSLRGSTVVELPGDLLARYDANVRITWPQSVGAGVRHQLNCCNAISADVIWYDWSGAFDDLEINLSNPDSILFPPVVEERVPLQWRDSVSLRTGFEHFFCNGSVLRLGYVYHRNPIPAATLTPWIQATLEHCFSIGYGWCWNGWELDAAYMYAFGPSVDVGASGLLGGDFDQSRHEAQTHCISLGAIRRF